MSCRHDMANGVCAQCYPSTKDLRSPGSEEDYAQNLEGPGAVEACAGKIEIAPVQVIEAHQDRRTDCDRVLQDVGELFARARRYDDKPHQLYSHIAAMAERWSTDADEKTLVQTLMNMAYHSAHAPRATEQSFLAVIDQHDRIIMRHASAPGCTVPEEVIEKEADPVKLLVDVFLDLTNEQQHEAFQRITDITIDVGR